MNKQSLKKQSGMTLISWTVVLVFVGFQFMLLVKIGPVFAEDFAIKSVWKKLESDVALVGATPKQIHKAILAKTKVNNIYGFDLEKVSIKKSKGYYIVTVEYEPRDKIIGKLDYIYNIKHVAKIKM
ncbi:MAG: DUF4845 domain-containing protein [Gammaproteobacteria bacterium]|nr:DUF4845 domain-containing protein [Gammaproteobacteria bacterium]